MNRRAQIPRRGIYQRGGSATLFASELRGGLQRNQDGSFAASLRPFFSQKKEQSLVFVGSSFPFGKTEKSGIGNEEEKLFFFQKVFLFEIFPRKISNSLFKNAPFRMGVPLPAESGQGLRSPGPAPKGLSPFGIRKFAGESDGIFQLSPRVQFSITLIFLLAVL